MDPRLSILYKLPAEPSSEEIYLQDLAEHCACLEDRVHSILDSLSPADRSTIESYLAVRDDLEFYSVKRALRIGKAHAQTQKLSP